jgi:hypothetical protein
MTGLTSITLTVIAHGTGVIDYGVSPGHTHPKSAFIYATVLEGAIRFVFGLSVRFRCFPKRIRP